MPVTTAVTTLPPPEPVLMTVCVPDLVVKRISIEDDLVVAEYEEGRPPEQWFNPDLKEESKVVLEGFPEPNEEYQQMYGGLMLAMRQSKRVLEEDALREFLNVRRADGVGAFVQKYGVFKRPQTGLEKIRVSLKGFMYERIRLHSLLSVWTLLMRGETNEASAKAKEAGIEFGREPHFALSLHLSTRLAYRSILTLVATKEGLKPVLYCRDVITGLYALLLQAVVRGRPWLVCPNCATPFPVGRVGKKFCGERCQQAYKQRRYRNAAKQKTKRRKKNKR
jgi:predicted nucleic acid-binding Zn ribbon protein